MTKAKPAKIVVVDDDPDVIEQLSLVLSQDGYEVHAAESAAEAEDLLLSLQPDLAVIDLMMEERDSGFVLCHQLKKLYPETPVIMLTAVKAVTGMSFDATSAEEKSWIEADRVLDKPVPPERLRAEVRRLLSKAAVGRPGVTAHGPAVREDKSGSGR